jgi:putative transposase
VVVEFIDAFRVRFGVEPICRVLSEHGVKIAPSGYYAFKARPVSARGRRDELLLVEIERIFHDRDLGRGLAGARKIWRLLSRQLAEGSIDAELAQRLGPVARCTVERLMRRGGLAGMRRGGPKVITTRPDRSAPRPPDLVDRDFHAEAPNRLWVVDFTYVATWSGMAFTAFVTDVFSRRIVGWRTASRMPTELPLDALEMALWTRQRAGQTDERGRLDGLVQHSDAGSQGGFNRSSQHLDLGGVDGQADSVDESAYWTGADEVPGGAAASAGSGARVLA